MIPWKNPEKELPAPGEKIWILNQHWKKEGILSCEIMGCEVRRVTTDQIDVLVAENTDYTGAGWVSFDLKVFTNGEKERERPLAWCRMDELLLPEWIDQRARK